MSKVLDYTTTSSSYTLKLANTKFTNSTAKPVTLKSAGSSQAIPAGKTVALALTVQAINYGAQDFYLAGGPSYTASATQTAVLATAGTNLTVTVS